MFWHKAKGNCKCSGIRRKGNCQLRKKCKLRKHRDRNQRRRIKSLPLLTALLMSVSLLGGCGTPEEGTGTEERGIEGAGEMQGADDAGGVAMGRYLEETTDLGDMLSGYNERLYCLEDGSMVITERFADFVRSGDNGVTWETDHRDWRSDMLEENVYLMSIAVSRDDTVGVIYEPEAMKAEEDNDGADADTEAADAEESDAAADEEEDSASEETAAYELKPEVMLIKPDGTQIPVDISVTEDDEYPCEIWSTEEGRMFVTTLGPNIYEVHEDGSSEVFLTVEERPQVISFLGNKMIMDGYYYDSLLIYDMEQEKYIEDEVLDDFIHENYGERSFNGGSWYDLYFFPGEDDILYLAGKKGLHRHVLGGSAMEQVIDGNLTTFNNPAYGLFDMVALDDNEFLALFSGGRLVRYVYHADVPTMPSETIIAYSLEDNTILRRAISIYQNEHPEMYVEYEIGITEDSSVTREDAIKKLNTQIMAGEGPDLLLLDGLPANSYIDKGLLLELSGFASSLNGEEALFENITEAFRTESGIYMLPCEFSIPVVIGDKACVEKLDSLEAIADIVEKLRREHPKEDLLHICSAKGIIRKFTPLCAPAWKTESGEADMQAIADYLEACRRIYEAQMEGLPEEVTEAYEEDNEDWVEWSGMTKEDDDFGIGYDPMSYLLRGNSHAIEIGSASGAYDYSDVTSILYVKGFEDVVTARIAGQCEDVFYVDTLAGINAASAHAGQAQELLRVLLGKENGKFGSFVTNRAAFEYNLLPEKPLDGSDDEIYGYWAMSDEDGNYIEKAVYWMDEAGKDTLRQWVAELKVPYIKDTVLEDAVCTEGITYIEGNQNMEETIDAIKDKISIYMAE